jgi:hypothetical protein
LILIHSKYLTSLFKKRALEPVSVDGAIDFYVAACNLFESEDRGRFAVDTFKKTIAIMIKNKR